MRDMVAARARLLALASSDSEEDTARLAEELDAFDKRAARWDERKAAADLWRAWTNVHIAGDTGDDKDLERLAVRALKLRDPVEQTILVRIVIQRVGT